jgi:O-antigen/teichoic acid export membrane protein
VVLRERCVSDMQRDPFFGDVDVGASEDRLSTIGGMAVALWVSRTTTIVLGAIAWLLATRLFSVEAIGESAAIVGTCTFVASASLLGFDQAVIRFAAAGQRRAQSEMIAGAMVASPMIAFGLGALAIVLVLGPTLPKTPIGVVASWLAIPATAALGSASVMGEAGLLALGKPRAIMVANLAIALGRLVAIGSLVVVSAPIYTAYLVSWAAGVVIAASFLRHNLDLTAHAARRGLRRLRVLIGYSLTSYLATTLDVAALSLLPLLILRLTDAATAGVFQVVWLISLSLYALPGSVARAAFAYQSKGGVSAQLRRRIALISIVGGAVLAGIVILTATPVLTVIGPVYARGVGALVWFAATIPIAAYSGLRVTDIRVSGDMRWLVLASLVHLLVLLTGIALLLRTSDLTGVGFAWFVSQTVFAAMVSGPFAHRVRTSDAKSLPGVGR